MWRGLSFSGILIFVNFISDKFSFSHQSLMVQPSLLARQRGINFKRDDLSHHTNVTFLGLKQTNAMMILDDFNSQVR